MIENIHLSPNVLTAMVAVTLATMYTKIDQHRFSFLVNIAHITVPNSQSQVFKDARDASRLFIQINLFFSQDQPLSTIA